MKNQFFYTRKEENPSITVQNAGEPAKPMTKEYLDSFSLDKVIRSLELEDGRRLVLLNDIHERLQVVPQFNTKGKVVGQTKERNTFQSEIYLSKEDNARFVAVCQ